MLYTPKKVLKIIVAGNGGIGKTTLMKSFCYDRYAEDEKLKDDLLEGMNLFNSRAGRRKLAKGDITYIFPPYVAFFYRILSDEKSRIYVERFTSPLEEGSFTFDLFDNEGFYLQRVKTSLFPAIIRDGLFYVIEQNPETGIESINRYRITNWAQIKEKAKL